MFLHNQQWKLLCFCLPALYPICTNIHLMCTIHTPVCLYIQLCTHITSGETEICVPFCIPTCCSATCSDWCNPFYYSRLFELWWPFCCVLYNYHLWVLVHNYVLCMQISRNDEFTYIKRKPMQFNCTNKHTNIRSVYKYIGNAAVESQQTVTFAVWHSSWSVGLERGALYNILDSLI